MHRHKVVYGCYRIDSITMVTVIQFLISFVCFISSMLQSYSHILSGLIILYSVSTDKSIIGLIFQHNGGLNDEH